MMNLSGRDIPSDSRRIVGFARDISPISDEEYLAMKAPKAIERFRGDLKNKNLEYRGARPNRSRVPVDRFACRSGTAWRTNCFMGCNSGRWRRRLPVSGLLRYVGFWA